MPIFWLDDVDKYFAAFTEIGEERFVHLLQFPTANDSFALGADVNKDLRGAGTDDSPIQDLAVLQRLVRIGLGDFRVHRMFWFGLFCLCGGHLQFFWCWLGVFQVIHRRFFLLLDDGACASDSARVTEGVGHARHAVGFRCACS